MLGLAQLVECRRRYMSRSGTHCPCGADRDQWIRWREWVGARRDQYDDAIREAMDAKREHRRRQLNERKRSYGGPARGK